MESAKLVKATGEPLRALQELENSMRLLGLLDDKDVLDLTADDETTKMKAKVREYVGSNRTQFRWVCRFKSFVLVG